MLKALLIQLEAKSHIHFYQFSFTFPDFFFIFYLKFSFFENKFGKMQAYFCWQDLLHFGTSVVQIGWKLWDEKFEMSEIHRKKEGSNNASKDLVFN